MFNELNQICRLETKMNLCPKYENQAHLSKQGRIM